MLNTHIHTHVLLCTFHFPPISSLDLLPAAPCWPGRSSAAFVRLGVDVDHLTVLAARRASSRVTIIVERT